MQPRHNTHSTRLLLVWKSTLTRLGVLCYALDFHQYKTSLLGILILQHRKFLPIELLRREGVSLGMFRHSIRKRTNGSRPPSLLSEVNRHGLKFLEQRQWFHNGRDDLLRVLALGTT